MTHIELPIFVPSLMEFVGTYVYSTKDEPIISLDNEDSSYPYTEETALLIKAISVFKGMPIYDEKKDLVFFLNVEEGRIWHSIV